MLDANTPSVKDFISNREDDWSRLETLMKRNQGRSSLNAEEIRELGTLYRAVTSDLAIARRDYPNERVTAFLNQLLTRAHSFIYQQDTGDERSLLHYFTHTIPQTFRATWAFTLVSFLLFAIPFAVGIRLAYVNPDIASSFGLTDVQEMLANNEIWTNIPPEERPEAMSQIATNNIVVALQAFGGGMTAGIWTVRVLTINGLVIGSILGLAYHYELGNSLLDFIVAHGFVELSIIFIAGGAGLHIGWAIIHPGRLSRWDALALAGRRVGALMTHSILALLFSGVIEGFLSPSAAPFSLKLGTGLLTGGVMWAYLLLAGWEQDE